MTEMRRWGTKIREAQTQKVTLHACTGRQGAQSGQVSVRNRFLGDEGVEIPGQFFGQDQGVHRDPGSASLIDHSGRTSRQSRRRSASKQIIRVRINEMIRAKEIRVIDENSEQLGIMSPESLSQSLAERDLDLVEVAPSATPPVCRIMNYGKFQYQKSKRAHDAKKHQKTGGLERGEIPAQDGRTRLSVQEESHQSAFLTDGDKQGNGGLPRP